MHAALVVFKNSVTNLQATTLLTSKTVSEMLPVPQGPLRYWRKVGIGPKWMKLEGSIHDLADVLAYILRSERPAYSTPNGVS